LQAKVWADGTQVDFERGLNYCIAQVRAALNDSADSPRFVKTVPKKGYQFIAPVERIGGSNETSAPPPKPGSKRLMSAAAAVALLALALGGYWLAGGFNRPRPVIAICLFDNETGDAQMDRVASGFTDALTAELSTAGDRRILVIGNAAILRQPRRDRNLNTIHVQLGADYVIIGQFQNDASGARVLAHLLRMPAQTHVTVERLDSPSLSEPLKTETGFARKAAQRFLTALESSSQIGPAH
jgi:TolB-like protein